MNKKIVLAIVVVACIYLGIGALVCLRSVWFVPPRMAADAYLRAIMDRDATGTYLYSDMLGPNLAGMMAKSNMSAEARKHLWAKDFVRWKAEFEKGSKANDSLKRERRLLHGQVMLTQANGDDYKAEVVRGEEIDLESYKDVAGRFYHHYYRLDYPTRGVAPFVGILDNIRTGRKRRIRSVVIRVEVARRPDVGAPRSWLLAWDWLDTIAPAFPVRHLFSPTGPEEVWMVKVCFAVDKLTLETF